MSLELDSLRVFVKVAELSSFTRAAEQLGMPKARASQHVTRLESDLGCRLLHRTTRSVRTTPDGELLIARAKTLVSEVDELGSMFAGTTSLRGLVRLDLPINLARDLVLPKIPELLALHPRLELQVSTTDRIVDVVREGFDCVLRVGVLADSGLVAARLGQLDLVNVASPTYLKKHGKPRTIAELDDHFLVHYSASLGGDVPELEWKDGDRYRTKRMRCLITVNNADAFTAACSAGLGIAQIPRYGVKAKLAHGELVEVLPKAVAAPLPVSLLHPHGHNVPKRVRVVMKWLATTLRQSIDHPDALASGT